MANVTDKDAKQIHGTNPQNLVEYIIRQKIYDSVYWKSECFGLSAERIVDKGAELRAAGGMFGEPQKPTEFICLLLKMLQIQPDREIIVEFIKNDDFKYLRLLGAVYMRLVGKAVDVFQYLEPLYNDYRKVRVRAADGTFQLSHIDEVIDDLLRKDYLFNIALPHLPKRQTLEKLGQLEPRISVLEEEFDEAALQEKQAATEAAAAQQAQHSAPSDRDTHEADHRGDGERERERGPREKWKLGRDDDRRRQGGGTRRGRSCSRSRSRSRSRDRYRSRKSRSRSRSRSRDRRDRRSHRRRSRSSSRSSSRSRDKRRDGGGRGRSYRSRSRSRSRSPRRRNRTYSNEDRGGGGGYRRRDGDRDSDYDRKKRGHGGDADERRGGKKAKQDKEGNGKGKEEGQTEMDVEIAEANALRAKLGMKPLK